MTDRNRARDVQDVARVRPDSPEAGGRFYFAKNSETSIETTRAFLGEETVAKFKKLKKRTDPDGLLESDLYRRIFG